jgi:hypothetical protein
MVKSQRTQQLVPSTLLESFGKCSLYSHTALVMLVEREEEWSQTRGCWEGEPCPKEAGFADSLAHFSCFTNLKSLKFSCSTGKLIHSSRKG